MKKESLSHLKSKLFVKLFMSYLIIITLFFAIFSGLIIYDATSVYRSKKYQEYNLKIQAYTNSMDLQILSAKHIISSVNSSETIRKMYSSVVVENKSMDPYLFYQGLGELKKIKNLSNNFDIFNIIVLFKGYNRAYTASTTILLDENFSSILSYAPFYEIGTAGEVLGLPNKNELTFNKESIIYGDNYYYSSSSGVVNGTILVMFQKKSLETKLRNIVGEYNGMTLHYKGELITEYGEPEGMVFQCASSVNRDLVYKIFVSKSAFQMGFQTSVYIGLGIGLLISVFFVFTAYIVSKRYYSPIGNIARIVEPVQAEGDEIENIISGIQTLIGERNGYREKMVTISPYARQGMLHGILNGNMEQERLKILSDSNFIDLKKPYFEIAIANIDYKGSNPISEIHYRDIIDIIQTVCSIMSTEETQILCYIKDNKNLFLIVNSEEEEQLENTFYTLHQAILKEIDDEDFMITFGVSKVEDNMNRLKEACQEAMDALDNMLTGGRNAVYFYENSRSLDKKEYYFPKDAIRRVAKDLKDRNIDDLRKFLDEIYKNNMDKYDAAPRTIRLLVDELHIVTLNALKINNVFNTTQIQIDKMESNVTLDEIFHYYYAIYETICNQLEDLVTPGKDIEKLNQDIIDYMNENFRNTEISLAHIGELFGVSNKYISLMCKNNLGVSYLQYIQEKRIEYARTLLQTTEFSLEQIAGMSGYSNMLTFRRNFKSIMGMNPSDYRQ
ncbi:hypothetical protein acsn021_12200 [Anaerocolumna cellulosilytica]|uniref:Uncharacterized protein n=1 Tax=Anaerocolumna cellulosilytica TaxID=433286 RepID=A0A6S6R3E5_9FIRM|nr:helix-turn-helix domain-containing protein [Anaerocolumna cellulosilytica]MBB5196046.1 AraC-like DNA-binding protein [Anaerocolumna cellulosilytica]BCJ93651.1 hypothetical protein acsn021_12200 [Anaerocolumna cellulosilytica]